MTNERDTKVDDQLVSETYRELADEQTPEHLNRAVLKMAAGKSARKSNTGNVISTLFAVWMKPVAWAATIALSLAIVLEYTELPSDIRQPAADAAADSEPDGPVELSEFETRNNGMPFSVAAPGTSQPSAKQLRVDAVAEMDTAVTIRQEEVRRTTPTDVPSETPALEEVVIGHSTYLPIAIEDTDQAETASITPSAARLSERKKMSDSVSECLPVARLAVESWLECITALRAAGADDAADQEYRLFSDEYPAESAEIEAK